MSCVGVAEGMGLSIYPESLTIAETPDPNGTADLLFVPVIPPASRRHLGHVP